MSDDNNAAAQNGGEQENIASANEGASGEAPSVALETLIDDATQGGSEPQTENDWRTEDSGGDERVLRELKRYANRHNVAKALVETKNKIRAGIAPLELPENATEEQVAEYRKAIGIPDTPDGYELKFRQDFQATEDHKNMLSAWAAHAHAKNMLPAAAKEAVEFVQQWEERQSRERTAAMQRMLMQTDRELESEYGADYRRNIGVLKETYLAFRPALRDIVLSNLHNKALIRELMEDALDANPTAVLEGDVSSGGRSLQEQIDELTQKAIRGKLTSSEDKRLNDLHGAVLRQKERHANAA